MQFNPVGDQFRLFFFANGFPDSHCHFIVVVPTMKLMMMILIKNIEKQKRSNKEMARQVDILMRRNMIFYQAT